jgi:hypothetical protein
VIGEEGSVGRGGYGLVQRASRLCADVAERIDHACLDHAPTPRDFARELLELNDAQFRSDGHSFPLEDLALAFGMLVPREAR